MPTREVPVLSPEAEDAFPTSTSLILQDQSQENDGYEEDGESEGKGNRPRNQRGNTARSVRFSEKGNTLRSGKEETASAEKSTDVDFFIGEWMKVEEAKQTSSLKVSNAPQVEGQQEPPVEAQERPTPKPPISPTAAETRLANELIADQSLFYVDSKQRKQDDKNGTYTPNTAPVNWSTHFESSKAAHPEDDGIYTGRRPVVSPANINSMEQRILAEKAFHWIDTDWKLRALADPTSDSMVGTRCCFEHERDVMNSLVADSVPLMDNLNVTGKLGRGKRLEMILEIVSIEFQHHHLFSLEHVYGRQLEERFEGYRALLEEDEPLFLTQRIRGLRAQLDTLKVAFDQVEKEAELDEAELRLSNCLKEIQQLREKRDDAFRKQQVALVGLIDTWAQLKTVRSKSGFVSTPLQLALKLVQPNDARDHREHQTDVKEELEEKEMLHMLGNSSSQVAFNRRAEQLSVEERLAKSRRRPGDPVLVPDLQHGLKMTDLAACPAAERARRSEVSKNRLFVKVLINEAEVCRTVAHSLNDDFLTFLSKKVSILLDRVPSSIKVMVYEQTGVRNRKLTETYIPVPEEETVAEMTKSSTVEFSIPENIPARHTAVGSGVAFSTVDGKSVVIYTSANIRYSASWSAQTSSRFAQGRRKENFGEPLKILSSAGIRNVDKLLKWISTAKLDPNDPASAEFIQLANDLRPSTEANYFRLNPMQQPFDFCTEQDITSNKRFQLLQQRRQGLINFAHMKIIPANENEVSALLLAQDRKRVLEENEDLRSIGMTKQQLYDRTLQKVRSHVLTVVGNSKSALTYEELVKEPTLTIGQFVEWLAGFFLSPKDAGQDRQGRRPIFLHELNLTEMQLVVQIDKAGSLPVRSPAVKHSGTINALNTNPTNNNIGILRPVIIAKYGAQEKASEVSTGPNPVWNKEISFRFRPTATGTSEFLRQPLEIHLYDEVAIDVLEDEMLRKTHIFQRLDNRWLGSVTIPSTALLEAPKIEGTFPLQVPSVLLGYKPPSATGSSTDKTTHLPQVSLSVMLEPSLSPPRSLKLSKVESSEDPKVVGLADSVMSQLKQQYPDRYMEPLVINTTGKTCLLTRYIRPLNPPPGVVRDDMPIKQKMALLARYVSLIPLVSDRIFQPEEFDVWLTNKEFLELQCGGAKEHAILLLSYFKFLNVTSYLLVGRSANGGSRFFVLIRSGDRQSQWTVWDAITGRSFDTTAQNGTVINVGMTLDATNVWLNTQRSAKPKEMQWDFTSGAYWKPLWTTKQVASEDLTSVQPESFAYETVPPHLKHEREILLKNAVVAEIMTDRSQYITRWNIECDRKLYGLLELMEAKAVDESLTDLSATHERELRDLLQVYEIYGFPLNMPYNSVQEVVKAVVGKGVHRIDSNNIEFSLAVSVAVYPQSVLSVWVYLVMLSRQSQN